MDFVTATKLTVVFVIVLFVSFVVVNAVLAFLARFAESVRKISKNMLVTMGVIYILGLFLIPEYILEISQPLIRLIGKIAPDFLAI